MPLFRNPTDFWVGFQTFHFWCCILVEATFFLRDFFFARTCLKGNLGEKREKRENYAIDRQHEPVDSKGDNIPKMQCDRKTCRKKPTPVKKVPKTTDEYVICSIKM